MTAPGGGEPYRDQPGQWQPYQHPPVDPQAPLNYPEYPYPGPPQPPYPQQLYGSPPPGPFYGYPPYDPYQAYQGNQYQTNGLAIASLITSITGVVLGIPLAFFCYVGLAIPVVGAVLGVVALNQIKRTHQPGRGLAISGIVIGCLTEAGLLFVLAMVALSAAALRTPVI